MNRRNQGRPPPAPLNDQRLLSLLVNPIRREILLALAEGEQDVSSLAHELDLDVRTISHGLVQLHEYDLVSVRQSRRRRLYTLGSAVAARRVGATMLVEIVVPGEVRIQLTRLLSSPDFAARTGLAPGPPAAAAAPLIEVVIHEG